MGTISSHHHPCCQSSVNICPVGVRIRFGATPTNGKLAQTPMASSQSKSRTRFGRIVMVARLEALSCGLEVYFRKPFDLR